MLTGASKMKFCDLAAVLINCDNLTLPCHNWTSLNMISMWPKEGDASGHTAVHCWQKRVIWAHQHNSSVCCSGLGENHAGRLSPQLHRLFSTSPMALLTEMTLWTGPQYCPAWWHYFPHLSLLISRPTSALHQAGLAVSCLTTISHHYFPFHPNF